MAVKDLVVDVVIPSKGQRQLLKCLESLRHIPFPYTLYLELGGTSWPEAVNAGLKAGRRDVILMDDDVEVLPETFEGFDKYYPHADIFGFKLLFPDGRLQHSGGMVTPEVVGHRFEDADQAAYMSHVTTSLCFIKRRVLDRQLMAEDYPGCQFEDVDFNFRAVDAGFRVLYVPSPAIHCESTTKSTEPGFNEDLWRNLEELRRRFDLAKYVGVQPFQST